MFLLVVGREGGGGLISSVPVGEMDGYIVASFTNATLVSCRLLSLPLLLAAAASSLSQ